MVASVVGMSRSLIGWDGAGGGYFDAPERPWPDDFDEPVWEPPIRYEAVPVWCDRCGRPRPESETCVACGEMDDASMVREDGAG